MCAEVSDTEATVHSSLFVAYTYAVIFLCRKRKYSSQRSFRCNNIRQKGIKKHYKTPYGVLGHIDNGQQQLNN